MNVKRNLKKKGKLKLQKTIQFLLKRLFKKKKITPVLLWKYFKKALSKYARKKVKNAKKKYTKTKFFSKAAMINSIKQIRKINAQIIQ